MKENNREKITEVFNKILKDKKLSEEMERVSPGITSKMAGYVLSSWLPIGTNRIIVVGLIVIIAIGAIFDKRFLYLLLILPLFSPRITAEILMFLGSLFGKHKEKNNGRNL